MDTATFIALLYGAATGATIKLSPLSHDNGWLVTRNGGYMATVLMQTDFDAWRRAAVFAPAGIADLIDGPPAYYLKARKVGT